MMALLRPTGRQVRAVASAGRRVDPPDAQERRFPLDNVSLVAACVRDALSDMSPELVVSSAACGADILVLEAALALGTKARIILPFSHEAFRERSVVDRPGDWGPRFDTIVRSGANAVELIVLSNAVPEDDVEAAVAYRRATEAIIAQASDAGAIEALVVWDGRRKPGEDETADLRDQVVALGWRVTDCWTVNGERFGG